MSSCPYRSQYANAAANCAADFDNRFSGLRSDAAIGSFNNCVAAKGPFRGPKIDCNKSGPQPGPGVKTIPCPHFLPATRNPYARTQSMTAM
jgi:hypothetical protein